MLHETSKGPDPREDFGSQTAFLYRLAPNLLGITYMEAKERAAA